LSADFARLKEEITAVEAAGADWIHVDVMDGHFVPNLTIGAPVVKALRKVTKLPLDVHLMIEKPERYLQTFAEAGSDYLTIHVEATTEVEAALKQIKKLKMKPGITLRPRTPVEMLVPFLPLVELVLVMTVEPGFGGQSFMQDQIAKVDFLRKELTRIKSQALIEVDGGITSETARKVRGADVLVAGNFVFGNDYKTAIDQLKGAKS
jgi:ribulose-phosphate 3-epimerase